jgi:hypothetical protein
MRVCHVAHAAYWFCRPSVAASSSCGRKKPSTNPVRFAFVSVIGWI